MKGEWKDKGCATAVKEKEKSSDDLNMPRVIQSKPKAHLIRRLKNKDDTDEMGRWRWNDLGNKGRDGIRGIALVKTGRVRAESRAGLRWKSWQRGAETERGRKKGRVTGRDGEEAKRRSKFKERLPFCPLHSSQEEHLKWHTNLSQWQIKVYQWCSPKAWWVSSLHFTLRASHWRKRGCGLNIKRIRCALAPLDARNYLLSPKNTASLPHRGRQPTRRYTHTHTKTHTRPCP